MQTGGLDSKFGFGLEDGLAGRGDRGACAPPATCDLVGLHAHIGSQIFELEPYVEAIEALGELADAGLVPDPQRRRRARHRLHRRRRAARRSTTTSRSRSAACERVFDPVPRILVEPGRSLVGNAGVTAYTVGTVKEIPGVRTYLAVDGGMSDNLRPMLYGSRYEALSPTAPPSAPDTLATVAGMHCESGDILIRDVELAAPARRRRAGHPGDRGLRLRDGEQLQRHDRARRWSSAATATPGWWCGARPTRT